MALQLQRTSCKVYSYWDDGTNPVGTTWELQDLTGAVLQSGTFTGTSKATLTLADEGVYQFVVNDTGFYVIYEFCDLILCLAKLIQKVFCTEECETCERCDDDPEIEDIRHELNKLIAGYSLILGGIYADKIENIGLFDVDSCRLTRLQRIDKFITDLKDIKDRCGPIDCDDTGSNQDDCTSC